MLAAVLTGSLLGVSPAWAGPAEPERLKAQVVKLDKDGGEVAGKGWPSNPGREVKLPDPVWPAGGAAVRVTAKTPERTAKQAVDPQVAATIVNRDAVPPAWRQGVVARVTAKTAATASVSLDYAKFRHAYGGDWGSRLRLWSLPDCALTTPEKQGCSAAPLPSRNDPASATVTGDVGILAAKGTATVALAAAASGPSGDFGATALSSSATWSAGGSTGDFTWSYPMRAPSGINGPQPGLSLSYSSSSVDGRSSASNNQPSIIGEGFDFGPGSVERRYVSCDDDKSGSPNNPAHSFEQCWRSNNATLSLGGSTTELVYQAGKGWRGRSENGSKIELLTGATNTDNDGEYWKVTTNDGTQYFFGLNKLPGQSSDTNSTWTAPVYGNHDNEPCNAATFTASDCTQAYKWNLDYVVDPHGNTMSYWYTKEGNRYAAEGTASKPVSYVRGGTLDRIDYGTWDRGSSDRSVTALAQVNLTYDDRCVTSSCGTHNADNWPDTPWDQECSTTATSCTQYSPTFWTTKRLTKVATRVWDTTRSPAQWQDVDSWTMTHSFPSPGDGQKGGLWLSSVRNTGHVGTAIVMPPVTFDPVAKTNRVLTKTNTTNNWQRMAAIHTETGAMVQVSYSEPDCTASTVPAEPHNNTKLCYPVKGPDPLSTSGGDITEWWHKYVVTQITETDVQLADGHQAPTKNTYYTYVGDPAWHYADDDGLSKAKYRTWDQFRGYATVRTQVGDSSKTLTETKFLRGMHGDRLAPSGGTRSVTVPASVGSETVYDEDQFAGMVREQTVYNGTTDKPVSRTVNVPWRSPPTASRTIGGDTVTARFVDTAKTYDSEALGVDGARGWRTTSAQTDFDDTYGLPEKVQDNGDISKSGDEKCTTTTYNRNTDKNLIALPSRVTTTALPCGTAPTSADQMLDDALTFYDGATSASTAPTKGDLTRTDLMKGWSASGGTTWLTSGRSTFDAYGRLITATDVRGNVTTDEYTPANGLPTQKKQTNSLNWATTTTLQPAWSVPTKITDMNSRVTDVTYDALGRTSEVWEPGWTKSAHPTQPISKFTYVFHTDRNNYPYVKSEVLNAGGGVDVAYDIYDGMLRPRQTQKRAAGSDGGRVVTDTLYDAWGNASMTFPAHAEPDAPSGTLWWEPEWSVPAQHRTVFDRAGRATDAIYLSGDGVTNIVEKWRTTTKHEGDRTTVIPPAGGTVTTTLTDPLGRTSELRQYTTAAGASGAYDSTKYSYDDKDELTSVVDTAGDTWTFKYDLLGRKIESNDPDSGKSTSTYNDYGDLTSSKDARNQVLAYTYDSFGRKIGVYDTSVAEANKRADWTYDTLYTGTVVRGQMTASTRYDVASDGTRQPFKWQVRNFTARNQIAAEHYIIPAAETGLGGTYIYGYGYSTYTGAPASMTYPVGGGLAAETVTTKFDQTTGLPTSLGSSWSDVNSYVIGQEYSAYGEPTVTTMQVKGGVYAEQAVSYELDTRRVRQVKVKPETTTGTVSDRTYAYDPTGKIISISDAPEIGQADLQCFTYDQLRRLTSAWTPKAGLNCGSAKSTVNLGGAAPYWIDWTIDSLGNRTKEVSHAAAGDTTRDYTVPQGGLNVVRPHAVTGLKTTRPDQSSTTVGYTYDNAGNMVTRPGDTGTQTLTWDAEGKAVKVVEGGKVTTNVFDPGGSRLIRRDNTGSTLFLKGQEVRRNVNGSTVTFDSTRYYEFNGATVASRTTANQSLTWLYNDHQDTQQVAVNAYTQQVNVRRQTPYGDPRGTNAAWPNGKGFVGGDIDPTGLIHVGAREYDQGLGRFISVDPIQDLTDPQQWNAYAYSGNDPVSQSDPSGLRFAYISDGGGGPVQNENNAVTTATSGGGGRNSSSSQSSGGYSSGGYSSGGYGGGSATGHAGDGASGGGDHKPKPKKQPWWKRAGDWVGENKNALIGAGVGIVAFAGCTALTGGAGALGCMAVGGAAANLTTNALDGNIHSAQDVAESLIVGGVQGALAVPMAAYDLGVQAVAIKQNIDEGDTAGAMGHGALAALDVLTIAGGAKIRGCKNSFAPGTAVLLATGVTRPISDIKVGDEVLATDPETNTTAAKKVEALHDNLDTNLTDLVVSQDGRRSTIHTTANHPFWDDTAKAWVEAGDLAAGQRLRPATGSAAAVVEDVRNLFGARHMLNLTVEDFHTYHVVAGDTEISVLVHNCGSGGKHVKTRAQIKAEYKPRHLRKESLDKIPLKHAIHDAAEGAITKFDDGPVPNAIEGIPEGGWKAGAEAAGRTAYGVWNGVKGYRDNGGGYPALHRQGEPRAPMTQGPTYQGRHRAEE
ncbi:polymorphic toxin-type HINT domain-containing protein [Actinoplanes solisilvae]|uniref:polymorphic toxin-type HINT domain-containing protein n=1 Tax=Actinoplanes solisilvae TaxID=2486853 RepID=UPI0013E3D38C|nr:polymorphic toxin-type HINT domain-containing protein [Actinoplanes solisilvae]